MSYNLSLTLEDVVSNGLHIGHSMKFVHPSFKKFILGEKNKIAIINPEDTISYTKRALDFLQKAGAKGQKVLFVLTDSTHSDFVKEIALASGHFYIVEKWLGGIVTNWYTVSKSIKSIFEYEKTLSNPELNLKKKEILSLTKKRDKLMSKFGGVLEMKTRPDIIFVVDPAKNPLAVKEAKSVDIKTVGIADSNVNPDDVDYPIPANNDLFKSVSLFMKLAVDALNSGAREDKSLENKEEKSQHNQGKKKTLRLNTSKVEG